MKTKACFLTAIVVGSAWTLLAETVPPIACNLKALTSEQRKQLGQVRQDKPSSSRSRTTSSRRKTRLGRPIIFPAA